MAQQVFQQHLQRIGQAGEVTQAGLLRRLDAEIVIALAPDLEGIALFEAVNGHGGFSQKPKMKRRRDQRYSTDG
jgi:hypothetical protein